MSEKILYSFTAIFDSPDEVSYATEKVVEQGYKKFDVHSPYPLHGMDEAMKLPPSKLGYVALVFGLSGMVAALLTMWWISAVDYPIVIGGKPLFSFPAYIPIVFEITVLSASIATVLAMLFVFFKLPNNSHPLHGTEYMKKVSSDKYGISIQAEDPKFDEASVRKLFESLQAREIYSIYWDNEELTHKHKILEPKFLTFLFVVAIISSGTAYFTLNKLMYMIPFNWMMDQQKQSAQQKSLVFSDGFGMRQPVSGTVARGFMPYEFKGQPDVAGEKLVNPIPISKESLKLGQVKFDIYCSPCHGYHAEGNSRLRGQFPNPPSLHSEKVRNWSDGRIFAVLTEGQNIMPSYATQLSVDERWAVINYLRVLQRALDAKETDLQ
ncbi:MAG: quinol:electron acceptor oxidoreductase subunit ActD [Melioribacteraceae bacterium]